MILSIIRRFALAALLLLILFGLAGAWLFLRRERADPAGWWRALSPDQEPYLLHLREDGSLGYVFRREKGRELEAFWSEAEGEILFSQTESMEKARLWPVLAPWDLRVQHKDKTIRYRRIREAEYTFRSLFEGDFSGGSFSGGLFTGRAAGVLYRDGRRYSGGMKAGRFSGWGFLEMADGTAVRGRFADGLVKGPALYRSREKALFIGRIEEKPEEERKEGSGGRYSGEGFLVKPTLSIFRAQFAEGELFIRLGRGRLYRGEMEGRSPEGRGTMLLEDGARYRGEFKEGLYHGEGELTGSDGSRFTGLFREGTIQGPGILEKEEGPVLEGHFSGGLLEGYGVLRGENRYEGFFVAGIPSGKGTLEYGGAGGHHFLRDRTMAFALSYRGDFKNGEPEGTGKLSYSDGSSLAGSFIRGLPHGPALLTLPDGRVVPFMFSEGRVRELPGGGEAHGARELPGGGEAHGDLELPGGGEARGARELSEPPELPQQLEFLFSPPALSDKEQREGFLFPPSWVREDRRYLSLLLENMDRGSHRNLMADRIFREIKLLEGAQRELRSKGITGEKGYQLYSPELTTGLNSIHLARGARVKLLLTLLQEGAVPAQKELEWYYPELYRYTLFDLESSNIQGGISSDFQETTDSFPGYDQEAVLSWLDNLPLPGLCLTGKKILFINARNVDYGAVHANGQIVLYNWSDDPEDLLKMIAHETGHEAGYIIFGRDYFVNENPEARQAYAALYGKEAPVDRLEPWGSRLSENFAEDFAWVFGGHEKWSSWRGVEKEVLRKFIMNRIADADHEDTVLLRDNIGIRDRERELLFYGGGNPDNFHITRSSGIEVYLDGLVPGNYILEGYLRNDHIGKLGRFEAEHGALTVPLDGFKGADRAVLYELELKLYQYSSQRQYHNPVIGRVQILRW
jgi:hypothetical protein